MPKPQFYIIDGHSQFYRCLYARGLDLTSPSGEPTTGVYGFVKLLFKLIRERQPACLAVAMDSPTKQLLRRRWDSKYKAHRTAKTTDVVSQISRIYQILHALPVVCLQKSGYEADDIIATLATEYASDDLGVTVVTGDKDLYALLADARVRVFDPLRGDTTDQKSFRQKHGYHPKLVSDVLALTGDSSDNIPTIRHGERGGFGIKTAVKWLNEFGSLNELIANRGELPERLYLALTNAMDSGRLQLNRKLTRLITNVPVQYRASDLMLKRYDPRNAAHIFKELGFARWYDKE